VRRRLKTVQKRLVILVLSHDDDDDDVSAAVEEEEDCCGVEEVPVEDASCRLLKSTAARRMNGVVNPQAIPTRMKERM
jgi:hypothetical protein